MHVAALVNLSSILLIASKNVWQKCLPLELCKWVLLLTRINYRL